MNDKIDQIVNDLFTIEPALKGREAEVRALVARLLESKPDARIDEAFLKELRDKVMAEAGRQADTAKPGLWDALFANRFAFAAGVAALTLVVAVPAVSLVARQAGRTVLQSVKDTAALDMAPKTAKVAAGAFGSLQGLTAGNSGAMGRGGGGGGGAAPLAATSESTAAVDGLGGDAKIGIMPPFYQNYQFKYEGDPLTGLDASAPVYKRTKDLSLGRQYARSFATRNFGFFNLDKFQDLELASVNFNENREFGYSVYFSLYDNSFGVSANWEKWPHPEQECRDEACFQRYQLRPSDLPSDSEIIAIANAFVREFGLDLGAYGTPTINKYWERELALSPEPQNYFIPESISVVYPLVIDGQTVKDEGGNPTGVYVDVNIRHKKGYGINGLFVPSFERSDYAAVTDQSEIVKVAENGGNSWLYRDPNASETLTLKLGTPTRELVRYWWYDQTRPAAGGQELYIPALVFPIVNKDEVGGYWGNYVTVPLVKDIFDSIKDRNDNNGGIGIPEPMPFIKAEEPASAGGPEPALTDESLPMIAPEAR